MRDIKFRGWNVKTKTMLDLKAITPLAMDSNLECDGLFLPFADEVILMQYTGLKDKNGVEIYEGDIDKCGGVVVWNQDDASFYMDHPSEMHALIDTDKWFEVIRNIHANPTLLEDKE